MENTKLKTLKELFEDWSCLEDMPESWSSKEEKKMIINRLKQEVIKHIKAFDDLENNPDLKKFHGDEEECWIKWFFNITEEDLK